MELRPPLPFPAAPERGRGAQVPPDPALPLGPAASCSFGSVLFPSAPAGVFLFFGGLEISSRRLRAEGRKGLALLEIILPPRSWPGSCPAAWSVSHTGAAADNIHSGVAPWWSLLVVYWWLTQGCVRLPGHADAGELQAKDAPNPLMEPSAGPGGGMRLNSSVLVNFGAVMAKEQLLLSGGIANDTCSDWENKKSHKTRCPLEFAESSPLLGVSRGGGAGCQALIIRATPEPAGSSSECCWIK